ncbi:hypothetical protein FRUB_09504 [Fimbriiglobus ruber]|uniref:Uncharacterized protein n=2 Tax=Fimbriiglobus ruber TaxID=1908690 RepID=A0A225D303_9BACT|nr:hypothetical protein FRUB_09504 [Fimbriiglobus ruber]
MPVLRQFLYGCGSEWCSAGNLLLFAAGLYLLDGRHRAAVLMTAGATGVGLAVHLRCGGWRVEAIGVGYFLWQTAVLVIGTGAIFAGFFSGAAPDHTGRAFRRRTGSPVPGRRTADV